MFYDDNLITIDGSTDLAFSENVRQRYQSYGWQVLEVDGHDRQAIREAVKSAQACTDKPSILCCRTVIAKGSPNKAGSSDSHGSPLGAEEIQKTKAAVCIHDRFSLRIQRPFHFAFCFLN